MNSSQWIKFSGPTVDDCLKIGHNAEAYKRTLEIGASLMSDVGAEVLAWGSKRACIMETLET